MYNKAFNKAKSAGISLNGAIMKIGQAGTKNKTSLSTLQSFKMVMKVTMKIVNAQIHVAQVLPSGVIKRVC